MKSMEMTPERWEQIRGLLESAMQLEPAQRPAYLDRHCSTDATLRKDVDSLLVAEQEMSAAFLESPAIDMAVRSLAADEQGGHWPDEDDLRLVGTTVSHYEILAKLGGGGMGVVYKARDTKLGRFVALKFLPCKLAQDPQAIGRLQREAHAASALNHPNICTIHDIDEHKGQPFIAMEYLAGKTLKHEIEGQRLSVNRILDLGIQLSDGLNAAHLQGIIHRDIKPANIFIADPGRVKILDFGLAKLAPWPELDAAEGCLSRSLQDSVSSPGAVIGTVMYMSPEQIRGEELDSRTDLFSFSAVLFEMATGQRAFSRDTTRAITQAILLERPAEVLRLTPSLPAELGRIIDRGLEKDRAQRYQSAAEMRTDLLRLKDSELRPATASPLSGRRDRSKRRWRTFASIAIPLVGAIAAAFFFHRAPTLSEKDTVVLADFANRTGDSVFDDTLKQALNVGLRQSPFLNVLSDDKVTANLKMMNRPVNAPLTPDVARELCQRSSSKAYIAGSIANLGRQYVVGLKAVNCQSGDTLAQEQATAAAKEKVLDALDKSASKLRGQLGESLATVQKFDVPLEQATTSSLEALKAYSLGKAKGPPAALPYHLRAVQLDPNFAMAYRAVGADYWSLGEPGLAQPYYMKAFELREHASEWEKQTIIASYYWGATGELPKAAQAYRQRTESYPRDSQGYSMLGIMYALQGQYAEAMEASRESLRLDPDLDVPPYVNYLLASQRFDEARQMIQHAQVRKADNFTMHNALYALAFLRADSQVVVEQQRWFASRPGYENLGLSLAADSEAYWGRLARARELTEQAVSSAIHTESEENGAVWWENAALREAAFGNATTAKESAAQGLKLAPASQGVGVEAALALAMAGDAARAESIAQRLNKRFPLDTQVQFVWLPTIRAQLALDAKNPAAAIDQLQAGAHIELAEIQFLTQISCLYPVYLRGEAYFSAGQGNAAAAEFQKILDHSGIVWNCWTGALAHLGVARASALQSRTSQGTDAETARAKARAAYQEFLVLWKDADPEIPILKQAKAEYAKLN